MKCKIFIILLILLVSSMPSGAQDQPKKPKVTVDPQHMIVHPGEAVSFTVEVERISGGTLVCKGTVYIDLEHPSGRGLDFITFIKWQSDEFSLHEIGESRQFEFLLRFKQDAPEGRYVVPITVKGEVQACPDAIPFTVTEFITFEVIKEPSNVSMKAWFANPCNVCVIPDSEGKAQPGTSFQYPHRVCNLGTEQDTFSLNAESSNGWDITLYWDQNNNKVLDAGETTTVESTPLLEPDECYPLILVLEIPDDAEDGDIDTTILTARSTSRECTDSATDTTTITTGTPRATPGLFECAEFEAETFVLQRGSCYVNNCVPYQIPVLMRAKVINEGPTEISNAKIVVEPQNFEIEGLQPQYFVANKMVAGEERTVDIPGYFAKLPDLGSHIVDVILYYSDQYGEQQFLSEQLLVKMEDTAKEYFDAGELAYKEGEYEEALQNFNEAKKMYLDGNFDVMVEETDRYIKMIKASQYLSDAMEALGEDDIEQAYQLLKIAKDLYKQLELLNMVKLIEELINKETPGFDDNGGEGTSEKVIRIISGGKGLTWLNIFLITLVAGLVVYIFMRRPA
jgi:hypothetical protein